MPKVTFTTSDPFITIIRDEKESIDFFGADYLNDFGVEVPQDLIERFKKNYEEFKLIQQELAPFTRK